MNKRYLNWDEITEWSYKLGELITADCDDLSKVTLVAVARGGLIPTQLIAYQLDVHDIRTIKLMSYDENNQRGAIIDMSTDDLSDGKNVYIIDDLTDSGATLKYLHQKFPQAHLCTLLKKDCCQMEPDICANANNFAAETWIVFPWD